MKRTAQLARLVASATVRSRDAIASVQSIDCVVFGRSPSEPRGSGHAWDILPKSVTKIELCEAGQGSVQVTTSEDTSEISLKDDDAILSTIFSFGRTHVDISGLSHDLWAPLIRAAVHAQKDLDAGYFEPVNYRVHPTPHGPGMYNLSEKLDGIRPLPGFARLSGPRRHHQRVLVVFLGFEGDRSFSMANVLDPRPRTVGVIGVPGFRIEFPFTAISCNRDFLEEVSHPDLLLARASCPFEAYDVLRRLHAEIGDAYLHIAPIGTKPHALGAVLYALDWPKITELMYDHPIRKPQRTMGVGIFHKYSLIKGGVKQWVTHLGAADV